jgi:putative methyltransferase (TIGR04325 family)
MLRAGGIPAYMVLLNSRKETCRMKLKSILRSKFAGWQTPRVFQRATRYLPPFLIDMIRSFLAEWEYLPEGWFPRDPHSLGWNDQSVADAQEKHWPILVANLEGTGPLGVSHLPWIRTREDTASHNTMMSFGYVLARAARGKEALSMLDWGGSAGHYYLYCKALLPEVGIEYHCHDVPLLCRLGRKLLPEVQFHEDPAAVLNRQYDLVVSSSSLHYFQDWREVTSKLAAAAGEFLYVARLQTVSRVPSFVVVQRPYHSGYHTEYLSWFLNCQEFVGCVKESGLELLREFIFAEEWRVRGAPEKGASRGYLFRKRPSVGGRL